MKRYALLVFLSILTFSSCSLDDGTNYDFYLEVLPIDSVEMPEYFVNGEVYQIDVNYTQPNSCYSFNDFIYEIDGQQRTIAVVNTVYTDGNDDCIGDPEEVTVHFDFLVNSDDTYVFKFFQGQDEEGADQYYLVEIPVMDGRAGSENPEKD